MKTFVRPGSVVELLEARIAPATLDITNNVATYTAEAGVANALSLSYDSATGTYTFTDVENIDATGPGGGNVLGSGGTSVEVPDTIEGIVIQLGDEDDFFTISGLNRPITVSDGPGADSVQVLNALTLDASLSFAAENVSIGADVDNHLGGSTTVVTDNFGVFNGLHSHDITVKPLTPGREIQLGPPLTPGKLSLNQSYLSRLMTDGALNIGDDSAGPITITGAIEFAANGSVALTTASSISAAGEISVTAPTLHLRAGGDITLNSASNAWDHLAAVTTGAAGLISLRNIHGFEIASASGIPGLTTGAAGKIVINASGNVTQTGVVQTSSLLLLGDAAYSLTGAANNVDTLAASLQFSGRLSFKDADGFTVGSGSRPGGAVVDGIQTYGQPIVLTAGDGDLVVDQPVSADFGTLGTVTLQAGLAGGDAAIIVNKTISGSGGPLSLTADHLTLAATVTAGLNAILLRSLEGTTTIDLGGADAAGTLGLTDSELDFLDTPAITFGGAGATNPVTVSSTIEPAHATTLSIFSAAVGGAGRLVVPSLTLRPTGAVTLTGANDVDTLSLASTAVLGASSFTDADGFTLGDAFDLAGSQVTTFDAGAGTFAFDSGATFIVQITGATAGTGYDQLVVKGAVDLAGVTLFHSAGLTLPGGAQLILIDNDGSDPVIGTFNGVAEGAVVHGLGPDAFLTYHGGDGNDVAIVTLAPLVGTASANGKSLTFRDVDGDIVTIKTTKGRLSAANLTGYQTGGPNGAGLFQKLSLDATFTGANLTITAKPSADGGNGFVNLGWLDATGVDLGTVNIAGDVARVTAGTNGGDAKAPAIKSLAVQSVGLLGDSTLPTAEQGGFLGVQLDGALPKLTIKDDLRAAVVADHQGRLGAVTIGGSIVGSGDLFAEAGISAIKVGGDIRALGGTLQILTYGPIGAISVGGSIRGFDAGHLVEIGGYGQLVSPTKGADMAVRSLTVKGSVELLRLNAGNLALTNADASIGSITVSGDWIASSATAGTTPGIDGFTGTEDDTLAIGGRDRANLHASIGSFMVKGQALGSYAEPTDMFGIVAEQIGTAKVGGRTFAFTSTAGEAFFAAPTLGGAGTENPRFDFTIRELGAATPSGLVTGGVNLQISTDGRTATFNDVDGDLVTVKRTSGIFTTSDFSLVPATSGGGQLAQLAVSVPPNNAGVSLAITAKPGPDGGNGFVNVGEIVAGSVLMGAVNVSGDLGRYAGGGPGANNQPGTGSIAVHSFGVLGASTGASTVKSGFDHSLGRLVVATDVRGVNLLNFGDARIGDITIGGSFIGLGGTGKIGGARGLGATKIGGSVLGGVLDGGDGSVGAITIGGDLVGTGLDTIRAWGQLTGPAKGPDFAIKSLTVKGGIENAFIAAGLSDTDRNADAAIGAVAIGHAWIGSNLIAGAASGGDGIFGTTDDTKLTGGTRDQTAIYSQIARITIKGQALGTPAHGDHFGIVAEQIGSAKVGAVKLKFTKGPRTATDAFAIAPTFPGLVTPILPFDFYLREIVGTVM